MKKHVYILIFFFIGAFILQGCRSLNPSVMLKTKKDFQYTEFPNEPAPLYKISPNDVINFSIYANDGFKLIDISTLSGEGIATASNIGGGGSRNTLHFKVEFDGTVKLPLLGRVKLQGLTVREAENFLEEKFTTYYNKPFVALEVTNRRVTIFPGSAGSAKVVTLLNENTTLLEGLAIAGGIAQTGKAYKVKLIRGNLKNPQVYLIDLSTIDGMKKADLILQANDIIYVEPKLRVVDNVIGQVLPYMSFITTVILFVEFFRRQ